MKQVQISERDVRTVVEHVDGESLSLLVVGEQTRVITWQSKAAALMDAARIVQAVIGIK